MRLKQQKTVGGGYEAVKPSDASLKIAYNSSTKNKNTPPDSLRQNSELENIINDAQIALEKGDKADIKISGIGSANDFYVAKQYVSNRLDIVENKISKLSSAAELGKPQNRGLYYERKALKETSIELDKIKSSVIKAVENKVPDNINTTTTYDAWYKRNMKRFAAYYNN